MRVRFTRSRSGEFIAKKMPSTKRGQRRAMRRELSNALNEVLADLRQHFGIVRTHA